MKSIRRMLQLAAILGVIVLGALLVRLADDHEQLIDISRAARNSLDPKSVAVLDLLAGPVEVTAFVPDDPGLHQGLIDFFARYTRHKHDFTLTFVDPRVDLQAARSFGANLGELVFSLGARHERLTELSESDVTNVLARLARGGERFITFLAANGERQIARDANHDVSAFALYLESRGLKVREYRIGSLAGIPTNTATLVLASPATAYSDGELEDINAYVAAGGNLLWLAEPDQPAELEQLAVALGVAILPGTVVDPVGLTRFRNPAYAVAAEPEPHATLSGFRETVVFPYCAALLPQPNIGWQATTLARTGPTAWNETGTFEGNVGFDADDEIQASLNLALALTRSTADGATQRVIVIGDGDFLSNAFLDNLGNREFGRRMIEWLAADDALIDISVADVPDATLEFAMWQRLAIFMVFAALLPIGLAANGTLYWMRRRRA